MSDVTRLIEAAQAGNRQAAADLLPLVYDELRALATARMVAEQPGHTLNPTALVHEAYLRLVGPADGPLWDSRGHFFAAAAEAIRRILIDHARAKCANKRGRRAGRAELDPNQMSARAFDPDEWLDLDDVMTRFEAVDSTAAALAKLRVFGGLSVEEAGDALGIPRATAFRMWAYSRAWITARLEGSEEKSSDS